LIEQLSKAEVASQLEVSAILSKEIQDYSKEIPNKPLFICLNDGMISKIVTTLGTHMGEAIDCILLCKGGKTVNGMLLCFFFHIFCLH
jgi:hypothetical protein